MVIFVQGVDGVLMGKVSGGHGMGSRLKPYDNGSHFHHSLTVWQP